MDMRGRLTRPAPALVVVIAVVLALVVAACEEPRSSIRPSPSLTEIDFSPPPTAGAPGTGEPTEQPSFVEIPVGWETTFCGLLADAVIAQELVIDIERAINEEALRDARGLTRDLQEMTADATRLLSELPAWEPGADVVQKLTALTDLGTRAAEQYDLGLNEGTTNALRRARTLRRDIARATPETNDALAELATVGIVCDGPMQLETF